MFKEEEDAVSTNLPTFLMALDTPVLLPRIPVIQHDPIDALYFLENVFMEGCILWSMLALTTYNSSTSPWTSVKTLTHMNSFSSVVIMLDKEVRRSPVSFTIKRYSSSSQVHHFWVSRSLRWSAVLYWLDGCCRESLFHPPLSSFIWCVPISTHASWHRIDYILL